MKRIVFRADGSTADFNMNFIFNAIKKDYPEAKKEIKNAGLNVWDCYISVNKTNFKAALQKIKGFASHAIEVI